MVKKNNQAIRAGQDGPDSSPENVNSSYQSGSCLTTRSDAGDRPHRSQLHHFAEDTTGGTSKCLQGNGDLNSSPLERVINALKQGGFEPKQSSSEKWRSQCPGHSGDGQSLNISVGEDERVLLKCFARECSLESILTPLKLKSRDLFPPKSVPKNRQARRQDEAHARKNETKKITFRDAQSMRSYLTKKHGTVAASWAYEKPDKSESFRIYRCDVVKPSKEDPAALGKEYRPFRPVEEGWAIGRPAGPLPLYRLSELAGAGQVFVVEGEKCVDVARQLGLTATTSAHGANSAHKTDWTPLSGKRVIILPDHDPAGDKYAQEVVRQLAKLEVKPAVAIVILPGLSRNGDDIEQFTQMRKDEGMTDEQIGQEVLGLAIAAVPMELDDDTDDDDEQESILRVPTQKNTEAAGKPREPEPGGSSAETG